LEGRLVEAGKRAARVERLEVRVEVADALLLLPEDAFPLLLGDLARERDPQDGGPHRDLSFELESDESLAADPRTGRRAPALDLDLDLRQLEVCRVDPDPRGGRGELDPDDDAARERVSRGVELQAHVVSR